MRCFKEVMRADLPTTVLPNVKKCQGILIFSERIPFLTHLFLESSWAISAKERLFLLFWKIRMEHICDPFQLLITNNLLPNILQKHSCCIVLTSFQVKYGHPIHFSPIKSREALFKLKETFLRILMRTNIVTLQNKLL